MDAIANQLTPGANSRAFQPFRQDGADTVGGSRRHAWQTAAQGGQRAHHARHQHRAHDVGQGPAQPPAATAMQARAEGASTALSYRRAEGTSLVITTQEGDTVKLKISAHEAVSFSGAQNTDQSHTAVQSRTQSSLSVSLEVKGDLNDDELTAIRGVVEQAGAIAQQFFDHDVADAFATAQSLQVDATQLANVGLRVSVREQLTYAQKGLTQPAGSPTARGDGAARTSVTAATAPGAAAAAAPSAVSPSGTPVTTIGADAPVASPTPATSEVPVAEQPATAVSTSAGETPSSPPAGSALDVIRNFLTQLMETLSAPAPGTASTSIDMALKLRIVQSVVTTAASSRAAGPAADAPLPTLVPDTLDALAAQQEPPLHALA